MKRSHAIGYIDAARWGTGAIGCALRMATTTTNPGSGKTMKKMIATALLGGLTLLGACSTTGHFVTPPNTQLVVMGRALEVPADGVVTTKPFSWGGAGGIPYRLEKNGEVVQQGKLRAKFRVVSIFWPPLGAIYWPMGFNEDITYDLVNKTQK
jgi:hypothetical protein